MKVFLILLFELYGVNVTCVSLAVDNLIAAQVVLADGSIVWANDQENTDLFFALRGAGNRFGVVTKVR